jgi:hypothetical protein
MSDISSNTSSDEDILLPPITPVAIIAAIMEEEDNEENNNKSLIAEEAAIAVLTARQRLFDKLMPQKGKREYIKYDCERARVFVIIDYWSPTPTFKDRQFKRFF